MDRPNVVLVTVDCLRYDRCGFNGHHRPTTPHLDRLAAEARVFDNAFATGMRTSESFPGILAGQLSRDTTYVDEIHLKSIPEGSETLASWFGNQGYETLAVITNPQLLPERNFDRGFDSFTNLEREAMNQAAANQPIERDESGPMLGSYLNGFREKLQTTKGGRYNPLIAAFVAYRHHQLRTEWPTEAGEAVVESFVDELSGREEPFFGWTHFMDLHAPLHPDRINEGGLVSASASKQFWWDARRVQQHEQPNYERMYDSALRYVDRQIGTLIDFLKDADLWDETILVVTSDHGEALYDRGVFGHGSGNDEFAHCEGPKRHYLFDELLRVPLLVRTPEAAHERISEPHSLAWLGDIVADELGETPPAFPYSSKEAGDTVVADALTVDGHSLAVRRDSRKLITTCATAEADLRDGQHLLFDTSSDRGERNPEAGSKDEKLLQTAVDAFRSPESLPKQRGEVDTQTRERLQQLGYR